MQIIILKDLFPSVDNSVWLETSVAPVNVLIFFDRYGFELLKECLLVFVIILSATCLDVLPSEIDRATLGPASVGRDLIKG